METEKRIRKTENMQQYKKQYYETNKQKIKDYYKKWLETNDPYEKIECAECKSLINKCSMSKHRKTKKCIKTKEINNMQSLELEINSDSELNLK
jgi:hypothetical protein